MVSQKEKRTIDLDGRKVAYLLITSDIAKKVRISLKRGGEIAVIRPKFVDERIVTGFMLAQAGWIVKKIDYLKNIKTVPVLKAGRKEYLKYRKAAKMLVREKVEGFNNFYKFKVGTVSVRNQKTRWGSCSRSGNLNFNFRIVYLPDYLVDYIVVHELCHLGELNHSKKFWDLVSLSFPDYRIKRKELRKYF
jgi:hypothetical protein